MKQVYLLDYSEKMLALALARAEKLGIGNVQPILRSWDEDWSDIPEVDICVASRSTMVNDIADALQKINRTMTKAAYLTMTVEKNFVRQEILDYIGRRHVSFPNYLYALNILAQQGYFASVDLMASGCLTAPSADFDEQAFIQSVQWSVGELNRAETAALKQYFAAHRGELSAYPPSHRWAFISWQKR